MSNLPKRSPDGSFSFSQTISGFLASPDLPFAEILPAESIERIFAGSHNLFGRVYTTAIVLWAFLGQVLRDGKEASCQSAVGRISGYRARAGLADINPDTRDYCRARAKLSEDSLHELACELAAEAERQVDHRHRVKGRRLGKHDHLVVWQKPAPPDWMSPQEYERMPAEIHLREIRYVVSQPGRKHQPFVIVTTLDQTSGDQGFSREGLAELFSFRWHAELDLNSIKTHLNLHHLRCKSPAMIHREFWTTMIACNAIRTTAISAASQYHHAPRQISFVSCCQYVLAAWDVLICGELTGRRRREYCLSRLRQIGRCLVGNRPGRLEPRVVKRRHNTYKLMMQPRQQLRRRLENGDNSFETK